MSDEMFIASLARIPQTIFLRVDAMEAGRGVIRFPWRSNQFLLLIDENPADQLLEVCSVLSGSTTTINLSRSAFWDKLKLFISQHEIKVEMLAWYIGQQGQYIQKAGGRAGAIASC